MNESWHKWVSHGTRESVISHTKELWHIWMIHVTLRMNTSWYIWLSHDTHEWAMAHMNQSYHTWMSSGTFEWVTAYMKQSWYIWMSLSESCHVWICDIHFKSCRIWTSHGTYEWVMAHMNESWHIWRSDFTCKGVMSRTNDFCGNILSMGWLRWVGSIKLQVSFAEYWFFYRALLQMRPIILLILRMSSVATSWVVCWQNTCKLPIILQHAATRGNTLQHTATHCNTLQHTATHYNTLQHTATHCNTLQYTATHCSTLQLTAAHNNTLQHSMPPRWANLFYTKQSGMTLMLSARCCADFPTVQISIIRMQICCKYVYVDKYVCVNSFHTQKTEWYRPFFFRAKLLFSDFVRAKHFSNFLRAKSDQSSSEPVWGGYD